MDVDIMNIASDGDDAPFFRFSRFIYNNFLKKNILIFAVEELVALRQIYNYRLQWPSLDD